MGSSLTLDLRESGTRAPAPPEELDVALSCDGFGRVSAPDLGARLDLDGAAARDVEHFLRRIVKAVYSNAG